MALRILSGVQSSGRLHLGNYYGAIREFVRLQHEGEALYFIANYHALTSVRDGALARQLTLETAVAYLALGLDPSRATLFRQSDIPEIGELYWILGTLVPMANLERATSYRDKIENKGIASPEFGLFAYPVLMAADILLYDSDVVPVGRDQRQHIEFARDWATKFNVQYVPGYDPQDPAKTPGLFKLPLARTRDETAVVPGRDGQKMSKSYGNTIDLFAPDKEVEKQIKSVKTDSTPPDQPKPVEDQPLYQLLKVVLPPGAFADADQAWRTGGDPKTNGYGYFKGLLLEGYRQEFGAARRRYDELIADRAEVERILAAGAEKARGFAAPVIQRVRAAVGL
ncbi:MAG: tryptophan--tRNA ligase [Myxococcaceae bacterium]|nr:tryptophan--tRNA ligase [Myxococcaceae bacterium]